MAIYSKEGGKKTFLKFKQAVLLFLCQIQPVAEEVGTDIFEKGMNPLIPLAMDEIVPLLFFNKNGFGIKYL